VEAIPDRYRAFVLTAAYSSLRWSELVALRVDRLDLVRDVIRVEEKIVESGRLIGGAPKTERSRRAVTLPHTITLELTEHLRGYPPGEDGLVFSAERGGGNPASGLRSARLAPAVARAGLVGFRFAQLRHTGATLALEAGRTRSWSRSGSATPRPGCSSSITPNGSIARTANSRALWTLRHGCGTSRSRASPAQT
jgi:integrase